MTGNSIQTLTTDNAPKMTTYPTKVIKHITDRGISGCVTFEDPQDSGVSWQMYVGGSQLNYATSTKGKAERLKCLLRKNYQGLAELEFAEEELEYQTICKWWHNKGLPMSSLRRMLAQISLEALVQIMALPQTTVNFNKSSKIEPILIGSPLDKIPPSVWTVVSQWKQWRQQNLPSPFTRLYLSDENLNNFSELWQQLKKVAKVKSGPLFDTENVPAIMGTLQQRQSLYQVADTLEVPPQIMALWVQPFLAKKVVSTQTYGTDQPQKEKMDSQATILAQKLEQERQVIACIDDSKTVQRQVRGILEASGYNVLSITEPAQALTSLVRQKPAGILMDVNMPDINGYELCSMLRQSRQLKNIPIMMLTGRDGIMDRMRAKMLGVNYYLTKPFRPDELLEYVQKLLQTVPEEG